MILLLFLSFLIGSIPTGYIVAKIYKVNLKEVGSKNIGAANVIRCVGLFPGIFTLIFDIFKGFFPVYITGSFLNQKLLFQILAGIAVIAGHIWTPFLKFHGGKGVATSVGVFLFLLPVQVLISSIVFVIIFFFTRIISIGSIASSILFAVITWFTEKPIELKILAIIIASLIIIKHIPNIKRVIKKEEFKF